MSETSGGRFSLSAERRVLLERLMAGEGLAAAAERTIPRRVDGGPAPLSPAQQRLWFLDRLYPGSAAYNMATALRLEGPLDREALRRAFDTVVERHEALRSVFEEYEGEPRQRVHPAAPVELPLLDLAAGPGSDRERRALEAARAEAARPFDLGQGPLLRTLLVRLAPEAHLLVVNMHHVVSDGWSVGVLARELGRAYGAHLRGEAPDLPELPVQYADFAAWQRERLAGGGLAAGLEYWRERLAGVQPLALPTDRPRPAVPSFRGRTLRLELPGALGEAAGELARAEGTTLFAVLLAAFKGLLRRYTGDDDVTVGTPVAGRERSEVEGLIGFFANTLALRTRVSAALSFRALVREVRGTVAGGFAHGEVPFEQVVAAVHPDRDAATPLFQVMFALQNATAEAMGAERFALSGLRIATVPLENGTAKFDLSLFVHQDAGSLAAAWEYDAELFDAAAVERMAGHFARLLEAALASPDAPLGSLALLPEAEREMVVAGFNAARGELPADLAVHRLFEAQAARTPDAVALVDGGRTLTYAELDARAGRLARRLRREGVGPEARVGLLLERSAEAVVALLASLKAGAAYVPLDPAYPRERLRFMAEDAGLAVLVARGAAAELGLAVPVLAPEAGEDGEVVDAPAAAVDGANAAYVIYTSGSTGRPKGTVMGHAALCNLVLWQNAQSRPAMRTLQFTPLSFDVSFQEILSTLSSGGTLVMVAGETRRDPEALLRVLAEERVERLFLPFVALQQLAEAAERAEVFPEALEEVVTAGEQLKATPALRAFFARSRARLHNHYGPTESHVVTAHALPADAAEWSALPPIGAPLPNVRALVLDEGLEPAPVGVPGELYLGGVALARGYLDRPGATAGKWLPDPFSGEPGARMYRTGDRVRWLAGGGLEYLGRADFQLKVRGFRVEPGEIESVLREHPAVRQAAVRGVGHDSAERRLAAYVVRDAAGAPLDEIRGWLRDRLPAYMVPSALVELPAMPLTPSGKTDLRALPEPEETAGGAAATAAPRDPVEEVVAGIWAALLERDRVGVHENFFDAGGHSLLVTRVLSRVESALGVALPVRELFAHPTVAGLAGRVRGALESGGSTAPAADRGIPRLPAGAAAPLSFAQQRLWFVHQLEGGSATNNLSTGLRLSGDLSAEVLRRALEAVVARHDALRTRFVEEGAEVVQRVDDPRPFDLPVRDLTAFAADAREAEVARLAAAEAAEPFDLREPPLLRARLLRTGDEEHVLLLAMHHIVSDGWSVAVFTRDLAAAYEAALAGGEAELAPLPVQYADFAAWQRARLAGDALERKLAAWKTRLAGAPAALDLPADRPRPVVQSFRGATFSFGVEAGLAAELRALARREDATLFMVLLAGFTALLHRYTGEEDLVVGSPSANRDHPELEELIGCFINVLPVRARVRGGDSFLELLREVRGSVLDAFGGRDVSFDQIVDALGVPRDPGRPPLVQVLFALQNTPAERFALPGVEVSPLRGEGASARYDLSVYMGEDEAGALTGHVELATDLFDRSTVERWMEHFRTLLASVAADPRAPLGDAALLGAGELEAVLHGWNDTAAEFDGEATLPSLFAAQARRTPDAVALVSGEERLTYAGLDRRANRLAHHLRALGVGPEERVGILLDRSPDMVAAMLAVLKAGGAYLPLDPAYPAGRLRFMAEDAGVAAVVTGAAHAHRLPRLAAPVVVLDVDGAAIAARPDSDPAVRLDAGCAAYVIYTSGSTGTPKGVVVQHRNAVNFFAAMRGRLGGEPGAWLAVTSISFDISVLELLYTLCHGARVVLHDGVDAAPRAAAPAAERTVDFGLFYFASSDTAAGAGKYRLLLEGARFADSNGFSAVWTPERHFHAFGGVYPSPVVTSAAIAPLTERIRIRAGSVVLPLHDPVRVAEEWSVVDNLSGGRVELSFASGWHADDFVLAPGSFDGRREVMFEGIEEVRHLWRGGAVTRPNGRGKPTEVRTLPRPVQPELPVWVTAGGSPDTFRRAGQCGAHLLTHLLGQSVDELAEKVRAYREARREAGFDPETGRVALMLHTYVADDMERVRETVRGPFREYLRTSFDLVLQLARSMGHADDAGGIAPEDVEMMLDVAFDRYFATSGLMGTPEHCLEMVERLRAVGVDEVACLIDFGVEEGAVLEGLEALNRVRMAAGAKRPARRAVSVAAEILAHGATHLQCTPSLAALLAGDAEALPALAQLECILLGGEALPPAVAAQLRAHSPARLLNMYGPTETTVWSAAHEVGEVAGPVPIGRPVANTQLYVVDAGMRPVPAGVAGELLVGGAGVTRGYHARPALTAERFVPDPFGREPGGRLYRTGDLARFRADGVLEFLGRADQQVKVRGHRIEPGEVEAALNAHPAVRESVVVARDDGAGERLLVAYLVADAAETPALVSPLPAEEADRVLGDLPRYQLPGGMTVAHQQDFITGALFQEVFQQNVYLRNGIVLEEGAHVVDVGSNIGMFTLFAHASAPGVRSWSFEPIPDTFRVLEANTRLYGLDAKVFNAGVAETSGEATFTFYPNSSGLSGRYADVERDRQVTRSVIESWLARSAGGSGPEAAGHFTRDDVDSLLDERFRAVTFQCPIRTLSDLIREEGIERIDLLKIDVEKSEYDVLSGIEDEHWPRVRQVAMEVDTEELLEKVVALLGRHGFDHVAERLVTVRGEDEASPGEYVYMLYAKRPGEAVPLRQPEAPVAEAGRAVVPPAGALRRWLAERLPEYMIPSHFVTLDRIPLTPNGKTDRRALPDPAPARAALEVEYVSPRNELEQAIAEVWQQVLGVERAGVQDNFFELGGTSLRVAAVHRLLAERTGRAVTIVDLFRYPTIASLAEHLSGREDRSGEAIQQVQDRAERQRQARGARQQRARTRA